MRKIAFWWAFGLCLLLAHPAQASVEVKFARHPAVSPDGSKVVFSWRGDLWVVASHGGTARKLTTHKAFDHHPVWSPDGKWIAFASRRFGNDDVYVMRATGGLPKRLTYHSRPDTPLFWDPVTKKIVFYSTRVLGALWRRYFFQISPKGGMPTYFLPVQGVSGDISADGRFFVYTRGSRRWWRKHNTNPYHRNVWMYDRTKKSYTSLTPEKMTNDYPNFIGKDTIVYRSEKGGTFNLWSMHLKSKARRQLTHFKGHGVRYVRASRDGKVVVFSQWDKLFKYHVDLGKFAEINIKATADVPRNVFMRKILRRGVSEFALSPNKKEVAFVLRGDVYVKSLKDPVKWARRVTHNDWREQHLTWSSDGRTLAFTSNKGGDKAIYFAHAGMRKKKKLSLSKTFRIKITRWTPKGNKKIEHRPDWSPKKNEIAFVRGNGELVVRSVDGKKERVVTKDWNIGAFQWSPDGRWFLFSRTDYQSNDDIFLVHASGKKPALNISRFPDTDVRPVWSANGKMMAYLSNGVFDRMQIRYAFLRSVDHEKSCEELIRTFKRWKKASKRRKGKRGKKGKKGKKGKRSKKTKKAPTTQKAKKDKAHKKGKKKRRHLVRIDKKGLAFRLRSLTGLPGSGPNQLLLSADGSTFYFTVRGKLKGLYRIGWDGKGLRRLYKGPASQLQWGAKGALYFIGKGGTIVALGMRGKARPKPVRFVAEWSGRRDMARLQLFEEAWGIINHGFYDPTFHGANWAKIRADYRHLIKQTVTRDGFDDVIFMMLGELNASHLGIYHRKKGPKSRTGELGVRFDASYKGKGLKIAYVRPKSPAARRRSLLKKGDVLLALNGQPLGQDVNLYKYLDWKVGRKVELKISREGKTRFFYIRPIGFRHTYQQRYNAWVDAVRDQVKTLSKGTLAYLHIQSMNMKSLDRFERELYAHAHDKKGLIIDVRNNGGGWTADRLLSMFLPKAHAVTRYRHAKRGGYPVSRRPYYYWHKPIILLCNERSGSNAEIFTHAVKLHKLGTVVGMPTAGAVISTGGARLLDGSWFRLPLRGWWTLPKRKNMENGPAVPHVLVPILPTDEQFRRDPQLKRAIKILLSQLKKK
ncbi:MAG: hypothetical protein CL920_08830 [Deltaproteobacteria bacterium]|mgnify:CR=1 FL=1|nr:hypothetical protein [Deltaproteobacteria bacterium]|tara:strand:+ start:15451 stop:18714 length:3264 start_codon:yes stop_codon:yes gene_type:complete